MGEYLSYDIIWPQLQMPVNMGGNHMTPFTFRADLG